MSSNCTKAKIGNELKYTRGETMQEIELLTSDGWNIKGDYYESPATRAVILLPMLNHDRSSYAPLIPYLKGMFQIIAVDLRGHGKSTNKGMWQKFMDTEFQLMGQDVDAAVAFLKQKNVTEFYIIGASIGANTALNYGSKHAEVRKVLLLSPGLQYRGISVEAPAKEMKKPTLIIVSKGDEYSLGSCQQIYKFLKGEKELKTYDGNDHGTNLFSRKEVLEKIKIFLGK